MIEFYKTGPEGTKQVEAPEPGCWVSITCPTPEDRAWLHAKAGSVPEFVRSALDDDESSHLDFDDDTNQTLVIVDCAALEDASDLEDPSITQYDTQPLSVLLLPEPNMIVTVSLTPNTTIDAFSSGRVRGLDTRRTTRFLLQLLLNIAQTYQSYLRNINKQFTRTEKLLRKTMRNEELIKMLAWRSRSSTCPPRSRPTKSRWARSAQAASFACTRKTKSCSTTFSSSCRRQSRWQAFPPPF